MNVLGILGKVWDNKGAPKKGIEYGARRHPLITSIAIIAIAAVFISIMVFVMPGISMGGLALIMPAALIGLGVTIGLGHLLSKNPKYKRILDTITSVVTPVLMMSAGVTLMMLGPTSFFSLLGMGLVPGAILIASHHTTPQVIDLFSKKKRESAQRHKSISVQIDQ